VNTVETWSAGIAHVKETGDPVTVNLLLTRRCDVSCAHCMYAASPKMPGVYMSYKDLNDIQDFVRQITDAGISVSVNMVGGEPTYDMEEFARCYDHISRWSDVSLEMTTNGSWLRSLKSAARFAQIIWRELSSEQLKVRISHSEFHMQFRKAEKRFFKTDRTADFSKLDLLLELKDYDEQAAVTCDDCGGVLERDDEGACDEEYKCNKCGLPHSERTYYEAQNTAIDRIPGVSLLHYFTDSEAVWIDQYHTQRSGRTSPVGRANKEWWATQDGSCHAYEDVKFTFMPGGQLYDPCCNGGKVNLGHASEGFLKLFARRYAYMVALHKAYPIPDRKSGYGHNAGEGIRCKNCTAFGSNWTRDKLPKIKGKVDQFEATQDQRESSVDTEKETVLCPS
jgi:hypothetical protein